MLYKTMYLRPRERNIALAIIGLLLLAVITALSLTASATGSTKSKNRTTVVGSQQTTKFGKILVVYTKNSKKTLYVLKSGTCTGSCAALWPPLKAPGKLVAKQGVNAHKLTVNKTTKEVSYFGHPLTTFTGDSKKHPTSGEGVQNFFVINVHGQLVTKAKTPTSSPPPTYSPGY